MREITPQTIVDAYGTYRAAGKALDVDHSTLHGWVKDGRFPKPWKELIRLKIQVGELAPLQK